MWPCLSTTAIRRHQQGVSQGPNLREQEGMGVRFRNVGGPGSPFSWVDSRHATESATGSYSHRDYLKNQVPDLEPEFKATRSVDRSPACPHFTKRFEAPQ